MSISYKMKLIDSARFTVRSLSNLLDNLAEGNHKTDICILLMSRKRIRGVICHTINRKAKSNYNYMAIIKTIIKTRIIIKKGIIISKLVGRI